MDDLTETTGEVLRNRRETHQGFGPIVELIVSNHENHVKLKRLVRSLVLVGTIPDTKSLARIYSNVGITSLPSKVADALLPGLVDYCSREVIEELSMEDLISEQEYAALMGQYGHSTKGTRTNTIINIKETKMNPTKPVEVITFVYGADIRTMSKEELLNAIRQAKNEADRLQETGIESTYITKEVKRINKAIKVMVKKLDS